MITEIAMTELETAVMKILADSVGQTVSNYIRDLIFEDFKRHSDDEKKGVCNEK